MFSPKGLPTESEVAIDPLDKLRSYRVRQISTFVAISGLVLIPLYWHVSAWVTVGPLSAGVFMMLACQALDRKGYTNAAAMTLVISITVMSAALMWLDQGIRDASALAFPVVLVLAGMLVGTRSFMALLVAMIAFWIFMSMATDVWGIRVDPPINNPFDHVRDAIIILVVCSWSVWFVVNDLRKALLQLREEIEKYQVSQKHLTYLSQHDQLTGLPNRAYEREYVGRAIAHAARKTQRVAALFVDLDNFKAINDSLGHAAGDEFLKQVALRLRESVRASDLVTRHGGDEFMICVSDIDTVEDVSTTAAQVLAKLAQPFVLQGTSVSASASIGIALVPDDATDYESILRLSDIAMYQAKESGRNAYRFFETSMHASVQHNLLLVSGLRQALGNGEFVLHYQPVVDLASGQLLGCEALIRWMHPQHGLVPPSEFISAAEKSGLIVDIGEWVLNEACRQMAQWHAGGFHDLVMAVNLSPVQFRRGNIENVVKTALLKSGLAPSRLELEITESTLIQDSETFMQSLQLLKELGVKISIDDFGTGYSNLSYLQRFAVNKLKIDQSFVKRIRTGSQDRAIVVAIIQMARSLNLTTTAEGVEDALTGQELRNLGCDQGQGFFYARPVPAQEFLRILHTPVAYAPWESPIPMAKRSAYDGSVLVFPKGQC